MEIISEEGKAYLTIPLFNNDEKTEVLTEYEINVVYNGNQTSKFGGSEGWTYLDSLNSFIQTLKIDNAFSLSTKTAYSDKYHFAIPPLEITLICLSNCPSVIKSSSI